MGFGPGDVHRLPLILSDCTSAKSRKIAEQCLPLAKADWDSVETSWDFQSIPVLLHAATNLRESQENAETEYIDRFRRMKELEEENNRLFIEAYGLQDELSPEVPDDQITLYRPNREEDIKRLISYAIGCTMGRYSLDKPGLIYAQGGNVGFDPSQYKTFPADPDGIVPLTETAWFADDATNRFVEFLAWHGQGAPRREPQVRRRQPRAEPGRNAPRHHPPLPRHRLLQAPPPDLQAATDLLALLQRQAAGVPVPRLPAPLPRGHALPDADGVRHPPPGQDRLPDRAPRWRHRRRHVHVAAKNSRKERETLLKQQAELHAYDEKLRHYADKKIALDLDDGVKVNYGKFGDLLAEVKAVTGGNETMITI